MPLGSQPPRSWRLLLVMVFGLAAQWAASGATAGQASPPRGLLAQELRDEQPLDQLFHTGWAAREGLNGPVMSLAQTTDGYLWVGTAHGLFRFDGVRFERFDTLAGESLQSKSVLSLQATPDNGLWVGFLNGGLSFVRDGHVLLREKTQPGLEGATRAFVQEKDGTLWVANSRGLLKRKDGRWYGMGEAEGYPVTTGPGFVTLNLQLDGEGNLWVVTNRGVLFKAAGQARFMAVPIAGEKSVQTAVDRAGRIWARGRSAQSRLIRLPRPDVPGDPVIEGPLTHISLFMPIFDRDGYLWYGARDGVTRERFAASIPDAAEPLAAVPEAEATPMPLVPLVTASGAMPPGVKEAFTLSLPARQRLTPSQGLTGDRVLTVFQDREGSIWIGTNAGLDRLRPTRVSVFQLPVRTSTLAMAADVRGGLWITTRNDMFRLTPSGAAPALERVDSEGRSLSAVMVDHAGTVWIGDNSSGLVRQDANGRFINELSRYVPDWTGALTEVVEDRAGVIWIVGQFQGLMRRLGEGQWERLSGQRGFPQSNPSCITVDDQGRVWMGYKDGQLILAEGDKVTRFSEAEGLHVGAVLAITARKDHLWIGGERGVQRMDAGGFRDVRAGAAEALDGVSGIVETPEGDLWLNGAAGITRVEASELRRTMADPSYRASLMLLDSLDGLPGRAEASWPLRTAVQTIDGALWFALPNALVTVDPAKLRRSQVPPTIHVEHVNANGTRLQARATGDLAAPAGTTELQIDYTAIALAIPERVRFKYRLRGLETAWHEAGARRQAFYTNLDPGRYTFEVLATNEDGVWSAVPGTMVIEIPPTFLQSAGFRVLCVLLGLLLIVLFVKMRLRQLQAREQERYRLRLHERTRMAQDLHDTLLQGVQGLVLRFQQVARGIPDELQARVEMDRVLDQADEVVVEGRNRVSDLHQPPGDVGPLEHALEALGSDLSRYHPATFRLTVDGASRPLAPCVQTELALVAREALFNAFQHAKATRIDVTVAYSPASFTVQVSDDGIGIPVDRQADGQCPGHWGLSGMRERVTGVGGTLALRSDEGTGTEVVVTVPAERAYPDDDRRDAASRLRRWWGSRSNPGSSE